jgi:flagellar biosynthesis protein FlhF
MKIQKFEGATMREALARVKAELGDQAVVISTRQIRRGLLGSGYEISAAIDDVPAEPRFTAAAKAPSLPRPRAYAAAAAPAPSDDDRERDRDRDIAPVKAELRSLKAMVRAAGDGKETAALRAELATLRAMIERLGDARQAEPSLADLAHDAQLTAASQADVIALVGPTGVGKTTTIAKIAARAALVDGRSVALVTLDNYRVGGIDQIRTFADLIGVPLGVAERPGELGELLDGFADCDLVLVDTAGHSPRDSRAIEELARALGRARGLEVHLALAATTGAQAIDDLVKRYAPYRPSRLLFTKLDEADAAPELVRAPVRTGLPVTWIATGQAVPEDLERATADRLLAIAEHGLAAEPTAPAPRPTRSPKPHRAATAA